MPERLIISVADIAICTTVLGLLFGWLVAYPRLLRLLATLVPLGMLGAAVYLFKLPFASIFIQFVLVPVVVVILLAYLQDLTRIYQAASRGALFMPRMEESVEVIPALAETLCELSKLRQGAIFVVSRREPVDNLISGGEELDCSVNRSLLLSIFNPACPRHDGAVVIKGDRICRIGGVLPLASAEGADAALGTRHLAALGLSQRSDADVFVVSEERGAISHASGNVLKLLPGANAPELRNALSQILDIRKTPEQPRNRMLIASLWVVALAVSAFGSFQLTALRQIEQEKPKTNVVPAQGRVRVNIADPEHYYVSDLEPSVVRISMRAPEKVTAADYYFVQINTTDKEKGRVRVELAASMVSDLPKTFVVDKFEPSEVKFTLLEVRQMDIVLAPPKLIGAPESLRVKNVRIEPNKIASKVRDPNRSTSEPLKLEDVDISVFVQAGEGFEKEIALTLPPEIEPIKNNGKVKVFFDLVPKS